MKIITMYTDCLTYEQLLDYTLAKSGSAEYAQLYKHISGCELCACAVNGFAAIPFTSADVDAIHNQIDVKINATNASLLTFAQVVIILISIVSIFGFYKYANSTANKKTTINRTKRTELNVVSSVSSNSLPVYRDNTAAKDKAEKLMKIYIGRSNQKQRIVVEALERIPSALTETPLSSKEISLQSLHNSEIIYIYDLKVTDYNNLYFNHSDRINIRENTPAFKENKETSNLIEPDAEQFVAADKVLKKALCYYHEGKYGNAISEFKLLLENNPEDVNALFYSGIAFYQVEKYDLSIRNMETVLKNANTVFHPEAKWNLALAVLRSENKTKAKQLFIEIANEKGFYAKRAMDKLKSF